MPATYPVFIPQPFANNAAGSDRNMIPNAPVGTQRASFNLGFPPLTMTPVVAGGKPMLGPDMNGILYMLSSHTVYAQSGQPYRWSSDVASAIGGYAVGTLLGSTDGTTLWYNAVAGNTSNPDANGAGWVPLFSYGITAITGLTGGTRTLTRAEAQRNVITLSGTLVANQQIVLPNDVRRWLIVNSTSGSFTLTVRTASGSGVTIPQGGLGAPVEVWCNGTNIYNVVAPVSLPISQAADGLTIAQRTNAGYLYATYFNQSSGAENPNFANILVNNAGDGFLRKISKADFASKINLSDFAGTVANNQVPQSAVTQHKAAVLANAALTGTPTAPTQAAGDSSTRIATTAFVNPGASLSGNGYMNLPAGVTIQWGTTASIAGDGSTFTSFPVNFGSTAWAVVITPVSGQSDFQTNNTVTSKTNAGFIINHRGNSAAAFNWIAIGPTA